MARTIKRYDNRKLYDTEASSYVSQKDLAEMVRAGETVRVVDNTTGEDLTAQTLTQVILEEGKESGHGLLPTDLLHGLLRRGGEAFDQGARQVGQSISQVKSGLDDLVQQSLSRLNRLTRGAAGEGSARSSEVEALHEQLARLEARLAEVLDQVEEQNAREQSAKEERKGKQAAGQQQSQPPSAGQARPGKNAENKREATPAREAAATAEDEPRADGAASETTAPSP